MIKEIGWKAVGYVGVPCNNCWRSTCISDFKLYQEAMAMYRQAAQERDIAVAELEIRKQNGT